MKNVLSYFLLMFIFTFVLQSTINESHSNTIISTCQSLKKMKIDSNHQPNNEDEHEHELTSIVDGASDEVHYASLVPLSSSSVYFHFSMNEN